VVGNSTAIKRCYVNTISHAGAAMNLLIREELSPGQNIMLDIKYPDRVAPINMIVKLKWFEYTTGDGDYNAAAGGVITFIKDEDRKTLLEYAYNQLLTLGG
jgi:hypothetical protein